MEEVNYKNVTVSGALRGVSDGNKLTIPIALLHLLNDDALVVKDHLVRVVFGDGEVQGVRADEAGLGKVNIELEMGVSGPHSIAVGIAVRVPDARCYRSLLQRGLLQELSW